MNGEIDPQIIERRNGGWLAITPRWAAVRIGAAGQSENEAREKFARLVSEWAHARQEELLINQPTH